MQKKYSALYRPLANKSWHKVRTERGSGESG